MERRDLLAGLLRGRRLQRRGPPRVDPTLPRTPRDENGCELVLNDAFCANVFDQCECTAHPVCDPGPARLEGPDARATGCSLASPRVGPGIFWPCEFRGRGPGGSPEYTGDRDLCTQEFCCEPNPRCRYLRGQRDPRSGIPSQPPGTTVILDATRAPLCGQGVPHREGLPWRVGGVAPTCVRMEDLASPQPSAEKANDLEFT